MSEKMAFYMLICKDIYKLYTNPAVTGALEMTDNRNGKMPHWQRQDRIGDEEEPFRPSNLTRLSASNLQISDNKYEYGGDR